MNNRAESKNIKVSMIEKIIINFATPIEAPILPIVAFFEKSKSDPLMSRRPFKFLMKYKIEAYQKLVRSGNGGGK